MKKFSITRWDKVRNLYIRNNVIYKDWDLDIKEKKTMGSAY